MRVAPGRQALGRASRRARMLMKIRDVIRLLHEDGWVLVTQRGSHRQFKHPTKPGRVTVAGHEGAELKQKTLNSVLKQAGIK